MQYTRVTNPGASYFFTLNITNRKSKLLLEHIDKLRNAFTRVKSKHPFKLDAIVILPDHLHAIMTLPENDANYSMRWSLIKSYFSRGIVNKESITNSRKSKRERGIWQRRFWEHCIRDPLDYQRHVDYIHFNPVKHGYVEKAVDWHYSSIHRYISQGVLAANWGGGYAEDSVGEFGEW